MNDAFWIDAIGLMDNELIENYITEKHKVKKKRELRQKYAPLRWSAYVAACLILVIIAIPSVMNLIGYGAGATPNDGQEYEQPNTIRFKNYDELSAVIGNETLLSNLDREEFAVNEIILSHGKNDPTEYISVIYAVEIPDGVFSVEVYFPPYTDKQIDMITNGQTADINGVSVKYKEISELGASGFNYLAEFDYGDYKYTVSSASSADEMVFFDMLEILISGKVAIQ